MFPSWIGLNRCGKLIVGSSWSRGMARQAGCSAWRELGALLERANLFISNDSGPVHIAASLNTPVIALFSRKNAGLAPLRWRPLSEGSCFIHKDTGCVECRAHNCVKGFMCLQAITPEEVAHKAFALLEIPKK